MNQINRTDLTNKCGICQKEETDAFWVSPRSSVAHKDCIKLIEVSEKVLKEALEKLFKTPEERSSARLRAIYAVVKVCGSDTFLSYRDKNGEAALTQLFRTVGIKALTNQANL